jgi:hypothetical protein
MSDATKAINACTGLVARLVPHCAPVIAAQPPGTDKLADSLAAQGNAIAAQANYITFATLLLGIVALVLTFGWGWLVKIWAEKSATDAVNEWMDKNANDVISRRVADLIPSETDGNSRRPMTQEEQEKGLGGDPTKDAG